VVACIDGRLRAVRLTGLRPPHRKLAGLQPVGRPRLFASANARSRRAAARCASAACRNPKYKQPASRSCRFAWWSCLWADISYWSAPVGPCRSITAPILRR
jgi:hypothetical protein